MENKSGIKNIDFNCDLAQTLEFTVEDKALQIVEYMSSVNIACGFHSGSPLSMKKAMEFCKFKNKVIGAHLGIPEVPQDEILRMTDEDVEAVVLYQLGAISAFAKAYSLNIEHVRPHGLMYKLAAENLDFSVKIARAVKKYSKWFVYYGAAGECIDKVAEIVGINVARELQLNGVYVDGRLDFSNQKLSDTEAVMNRLKHLIDTSEIINKDNTSTHVKFDTIHFSSTDLNIAELAKNACEIITPRPVNFNNVVLSGWVE